MADDAGKWDAFYRDREEPGDLAQVLTDYAHLVPSTGRCLDLACGLGANSLWLARRGLDVEAWDISPIAIDKLTGFAEAEGLTVNARVKDVSAGIITMNAYDCIFVGHYLDRIGLPPKIMGGLRPGGMLFYQTFTRTKVDGSGPSNPAYLLGENELLRLFHSLVVRVFRDEGTSGDVTTGLRNQSCLVAQKPG